MTFTDPASKRVVTPCKMGISRLPNPLINDVLSIVNARSTRSTSISIDLSRSFPFFNPADYLIGVAAVDNRTPEAERNTKAQLSLLVEAWRRESSIRFPASSPAEIASQLPEDPVKVVQAAGVCRQIGVLTSRTIRITIRDPMGLAASWLEAILMGIVCGLVYLHLPKTLAGIRSRESALYIPCGLQVYWTPHSV